jgi:hypothetical protein
LDEILVSAHGVIMNSLSGVSAYRFIEGVLPVRCSPVVESVSKVTKVTRIVDKGKGR